MFAPTLRLPASASSFLLRAPALLIVVLACCSDLNALEQRIKTRQRLYKPIQFLSQSKA